MEEYQTWEGDPRTELREGDLLLREMKWKLYHAGIYCGNNEVIEFTANESMCLRIIGGALDNKLVCCTCGAQGFKHILVNEKYLGEVCLLK